MIASDPLLPNAEHLADLIAGITLVAFDFDGVFTDNTVLVTQEGIESVRCWRSDGIGLGRLRGVGVETLIVSTETNPIVAVRGNKLRMPYLQGIEDKAAALADYCATREIDLGRIAFVGNDINDIPAFKMVGLPIAVSDAYEEVFPYVAYKTVCRGGYGAVREVCDLIYQVKRKLHETKHL